MKITITENLYPKLRIVNGTIGYVENIQLAKSHWIQCDEMMHPLINILVDFNEIKIKNTLQDINIKGLPKMCY